MSETDVQADPRANLYRPGVLCCAKCSFRLITSTLDAATGAVYARDTTEQCPNDGAPMWRVSWEQECREAEAEWEKQVQRAVAAESQAQLAREALLGVSSDFMTSENHHPGFVLIPTTRFEQLRAAEAALAKVAT